MKLLLVLGAVLAAHFVYYLWPPGPDRNWAQYVGGGVGFASLCLVVALGQRRRLRSEVGALIFTAAVWGVIEGLQQAVCGAFHWGRVATEDLCMSLVGPWPYVLVAAGLAAWIVTLQLRDKHHG